MKNGAETTVRSPAPLPAIRLGAGEDREGLRNRGVLLVIFMRIVALLWLLQGLSHWADLLLDPTGNAFFALTPLRTAALFFFCVLDLVAAVGLWLATSWGGVVWLTTVGVQAVALALLPGFWTHTALLAGSDIVLVAGYLGLAWYAAQDESRNE